MGTHSVSRAPASRKWTVFTVALPGSRHFVIRVPGWVLEVMVKTVKV